MGAKSGGVDSLLRLRLQSLILKKGKHPRKVVGLQPSLALLRDAPAGEIDSCQLLTEDVITSVHETMDGEIV